MTEEQQIYKSLLTQDRPFEAQLVTFQSGEMQFSADSNPVDWDELISSFKEDDTRIQIITQLQEPFEGFTMLMTCARRDDDRPSKATFHYVVRAKK